MGEEQSLGDLIADRFELRAPLGRGGSSTMWRALDRTTNTEVALKRLDVTRARDWKHVELFEREGKLLEALTHPAVPRYIAAFTVDDANGTSFYLAQSLIEGRSLAEQVDERGAFGETEVRDIARQVLLVLADLHAMQPPLLHRDLKPGNIIVDSARRVHLVDFGAARRSGNEQTGSTVVGTYGFMSPEQLRGSATAASDLYGLGATLVFLLYRVTPAELPQKRLRVELPKSPAISAELGAFLRRLLEPAPEDRYRNAREALAGLSARRSSRARVSALAGALVVIAVGGGALVWRLTAKAPVAVNGVKPTFAELPVRPELSRYAELRDLQRVPAHMSAVFDIASSADGKLVATASFDDTAKVWSTETWKQIASVGHEGHVGGVRFSDSMLVSGGDHTVRTWELPSGKQKLRVDVGTQQVSSIDVALGNVAAASFDGNVRIVSLESGSVVRTIAHSKGRVLAVRYSPDGSTLATGGDDRIVRLWKVADGSAVRSFSGHTGAVTQIAFSPDGTLLSSSSDDNTVRVFHVSSGALTTTLTQSSDDTWAVGWANASLVVGSKDARLRVYNAPTFTLAFADQDLGKGTLAISFLPDGRFLTAQGDGSVHVRALPSGKTRVLPVRKPAVAPPHPDSPPELVATRKASLLIDGWGGKRATLDGAEQLANQALVMHPKYALALVQLARIETRRGMKNSTSYDPARLAAAMKLVDEAIAADPKSFEAREQRAYTYLRQPDLEKARSAIAEAEAIAPKNPRCALVRAEIAVAEKAWEEAERLLITVLESGTAEAKTLAAAEEHLIHAYEGLADYDAVDAMHRHLVAADAGSAWKRGNYAGFLERRGAYARAIEVANEALAISDYPLAHLVRAEASVGVAVEALWDQHDVDRAATFFEAALKDDPTLADAHYGMAAVHRVRAVRGRDKKELAASRRELETTLKLQSDHAWARAAMREQASLEANL